MGTRKLLSKSLICYFRVKARICWQIQAADVLTTHQPVRLSTKGFSCSLFFIRQSVWTLHISISFGKEVIQPQVPLRLPCYDFTPVMNHKVVSALPKVKLPTSFATHSHGVTGGVYKARERIHRSILIYDY